jgi:hypothetical protein
LQYIQLELKNNLHKGTSKNPCFVIPAQAGIQQKQQDRFPLSRE